MYDQSSFCFMCLNDGIKLNTVFRRGIENEICTQVKYVVPELMMSDSENPVYICSSCHTTFYSFYTFKKKCLKNYKRLRNYIQILQETNVQDQTISELQIRVKNGDLINQESDFQLYIKEEFENPLLSFIETEDDIFSESQMKINYSKLLIKQEQEVDYEFNITEEDEETILSSDEQNYQETFMEDNFDDEESDNNPLDNDEAKISASAHRKFQCTICNKKYIQKKHLKIHIKYHLGIKNFQCQICKKKFIENGSLTKHMKMHTGKKDYECSVCGKKHIGNSNLKLHMKYHLGIKNFECTICNKKFVESGKLKRHMKQHLQIKNFECVVCSKKFIEKYNLSLHLKVHEGVKDFKCSKCNKRYALKGSLARHRKTHEYN